jgi:hypothetical protein
MLDSSTDEFICAVKLVVGTDLTNQQQQNEAQQTDSRG